MGRTLRPRALVPGDRVAVVAPASPYDAGALDDGLAALEGLGYEPVFVGEPGARRGYLAGDDCSRGAALATAISDPSLRAVFCVRGGYGTMRLLPDLDGAALAANPKPLVGFSDCTALLSWWHEKAGVIGVHGPVLTQLGRGGAAPYIALGALMSGARGEGSELLGALGELRGGASEGILRGGNLALVCALAGTPWAIPLAGSVLVLEDTNEPLYKLDRMLTQLRALDGWRELAGLVFGQFDGVDDPAGLARLFEEVAAELSCPVVRGAAVGHVGDNLALPIGARVCLDGGGGRLTLCEAPFVVAPDALASSHPAVLQPGPCAESSRVERRDGDPVTALLNAAVADGVTPGAALWVRHRGQVAIERTVGWRQRDSELEPIDRGTRFDLASITKPFATVTLVMRAVAAGVLGLDDELVEHLPWLSEGTRWRGVRVRHLLQHSAGLPDWRPLFAIARRSLDGAYPGAPAVRELFRTRLTALGPEREPGAGVRYSDLGFLLLGELLERLHGAPLGRLFRRDVASPLRLDDSGFRPADDWLPGAPTASAAAVAATERCPWRRALLRGVVHDENAYALGGVAAHAGLFATAADVGTWAGRLLDASQGRRNPLELDAATVSAFWDAPAVPGSTWALGWDRPAPVGSSCGRHFSPDAVGHLGFTGGSVWIDRQRDLVVVLLTNRVHPSRHELRIRQLRPAVHDAVVEWLEA